MMAFFIILGLTIFAVVVLWRRGWLSIAKSWRHMADAARKQGFAHAQECEENARVCERRAWPWRLRSKAD